MQDGGCDGGECVGVGVFVEFAIRDGLAQALLQNGVERVEAPRQDTPDGRAMDRLDSSRRKVT